MTYLSSTRVNLDCGKPLNVPPVVQTWIDFSILGEIRKKKKITNNKAEVNAEGVLIT